MFKMLKYEYRRGIFSLFVIFIFLGFCVTCFGIGFGSVFSFVIDYYNLDNLYEIIKIFVNNLYFILTILNYKRKI